MYANWRVNDYDDLHVELLSCVQRLITESDKTSIKGNEFECYNNNLDQFS